MNRPNLSVFPDRHPQPTGMNPYRGKAWLAIVACRGLEPPRRRYERPMQPITPSRDISIFPLSNSQ